MRMSREGYEVPDPGAGRHGSCLMSQNVTISHPICPNYTASPSPVFCGTGVYMCSLNGNASTLRGTADLNLPVDKLYDLAQLRDGARRKSDSSSSEQNSQTIFFKCRWTGKAHIAGYGILCRAT